LRELATLDEFRFYLVQRNALFMPTRPGDENILNVFPQFPVFRQIDLDSYLAALFVGHVLDSSHRLILL
jgi:hypothetical protein